MPQDYKKAVEWYTKAAEQGDEEVIKKLKEKNRCIYCGGTLVGLFSKKCKNCGKKVLISSDAVVNTRFKVTAQS